MRITSLISELEGSQRKVAMGIKCQISVDQSVFSYSKIYQTDPQVEENSLDDVANKILSKASVNRNHVEASIMPDMPGGS